jgi:ABC-2 type transport system permease protein
MLWYRAWLETRSRYLISLIGIVAICSFMIFHWDTNALSYVKADYYYVSRRARLDWQQAFTL